MEPIRPIRVALWAPVPPPPGGIGLWTQRYLAVAAEHGLVPRVINIAPRQHDFSEASALRPDRLVVAAEALTQLARLLAGRQVDVAHVTTTGFWSHPRDSLALAMCRAAGVPTVLHIRASTQIIAWREQMPLPQRLAYDASMRLASVVLTLSQELARYLRTAIPGLRVETGYNMVTEAEFAPPQGPPLLPATSQPRVLFVGAMTPKKGLIELCDAVRMLPDVELVCVGGPGDAIDAAALGQMRQALQRLQATGRLLELGALTKPDVQRVMHEADLLCLPSHREGLPNVLLEAMAAGLAVVITPVGGVPDVAAAAGGEGGGVQLVPVGDTGALTAALAAALADRPALARRGAAGQLWARHNVSTAAVMDSYRQIYQSLL